MSAHKDVANLRAICGVEVGVTVKNDTENIVGVLVTSVEKESAAEKAGIVVTDRIIAVGTWAVNSPIDFDLSCLAWIQDNPGRPVPITMNKKGAQEKTTVQLTPLQAKILCAKIDVPSQSRQGCIVVFSNEDGKEVSRDFTDDLNIPRNTGKGEILFQGFLSIPSEGSYVFTLNIEGTGTMTLGGKDNEWIVEKRYPFHEVRLQDFPLTSDTDVAFRCYLAAASTAASVGGNGD